MKIYVIKSDTSPIPLAEIRVVGDTLEFIVDNTQGALPTKLHNSFANLKKYLKGSSHLFLEEPKKATVNLLRYVMDNGDVVEITSDGHTVVLNGNILAEPEKNALFAAFKRGEIKVSRKTEVQDALPILPTPPPVQQPMIKPKLDPEIMAMIKSDQDKRDDAAAMSSATYDHEIEQKSLHDAEDKEYVRKMLYFLKYGDK